jgi:hypothetical protein
MSWFRWRRVLLAERGSLALQVLAERLELERVQVVHVPRLEAVLAS